jgi:HAMP domain-containing protein
MKMIEEGRIIFGGEVPYIEYQLNYAGIILALIVTLLFVMHYSLGPVGRMENILDEVIKGNYSLRITLREKDALRPFVDRLNKVLSLLENKSHS